MIENGREPDKKRYIDAVKHIPNHEPAFYETEVAINHVNNILQKEFHGIRSYELPGRDYCEFLMRTSMDMAYLHVPWKLGRKEIIDGFGIPSYAGGLVDSYSDLEDMEKPDYDQVISRIEEMLETLEGTGIGIVYRLFNTPSLVTAAIGYEKYYLYLLDRPDFIKEFQKKVDEYVVKQAEIVMSYPIDAVMLGNYLCMNTGPMISNEVMEEFEYPYLQKLTDLAHRENKIVEYHADGNYTSLYPKLIDIGIDVVQAIQDCEGKQNIFRLKEQYGESLAFHGDIDVDRFLINGTEDEITKEVNTHIQILNKGGGYICGSSHDINAGVKHQNFLAMIQSLAS